MALLIRKPVVAGAFYPADATQLREEIAEHYRRGTRFGKNGHSAWGVMVPHAGYIYCGDLIAATLNNANLPENLVILCPNHTGRGVPLGVWPEGDWLTPLGAVPVDTEMASCLCRGPFQADVKSHLGEHSIEVLLPFLQSQGVKSIVPVCVGTHDRILLKRAGQSLAHCLRPGWGVVVSSDMNHYESGSVTELKDLAVLKMLEGGDPNGLLDVVGQFGVSMCGAAPAALALYAARKSGNIAVEVIGHDTSATASGDDSRVVGYAGARFYLPEAMNTGLYCELPAWK